MQYEIEVEGHLRHVNVHRAGDQFVVTVDGRDHVVDAARIDTRTLSMLVRLKADATDGPSASHEVTIAPDAAGGQLQIAVDGTAIAVSLNSRRRWGRKDEGAHGVGPQRLVAPMPGKIVRVLVNRHDVVKPRQPLVVIEAMKMENELRAPAAGTVAELHVQEGESVDAGTLLAVVAPA